MTYIQKGSPFKQVTQNVTTNSACEILLNTENTTTKTSQIGQECAGNIDQNPSTG